MGYLSQEIHEQFLRTCHWRIYRWYWICRQIGCPGRLFLSLFCQWLCSPNYSFIFILSKCSEIIVGVINCIVRWILERLGCDGSEVLDSRWGCKVVTFRCYLNEDFSMGRFSKSIFFVFMICIELILLYRRIFVAEPWSFCRVLESGVSFWIMACEFNYFGSNQELV